MPSYLVTIIELVAIGVPFAGWFWISASLRERRLRREEGARPAVTVGLQFTAGRNIVERLNTAASKFRQRRLLPAGAPFTAFLYGREYCYFGHIGDDPRATHSATRRIVEQMLDIVETRLRAEGIWCRRQRPLFKRRGFGIPLLLADGNAVRRLAEVRAAVEGFPATILRGVWCSFDGEGEATTLEAAIVLTRDPEAIRALRGLALRWGQTELGVYHERRWYYPMLIEPRGVGSQL